jgi:putative transposase
VNASSSQPGHRRSVRLRQYDYSQEGAYFVTICSHKHECTFGTIIDGRMSLSALGETVEREWLKTNTNRPHVVLDSFVVMPNHFHGILVLVEAIRRGTARRARIPTPTADNKRAFGGPVAGSVPTIVGAFKSAVTRRAHMVPDTSNRIIWQRNYHEHVIRDERDLKRIREYIRDNPMKWHLDRYYST